VRGRSACLRTNCTVPRSWQAGKVNRATQQWTRSARKRSPTAITPRSSGEYGYSVQRRLGLASSIRLRAQREPRLPKSGSDLGPISRVQEFLRGSRADITYMSLLPCHGTFGRVHVTAFSAQIISWHSEHAKAMTSAIHLVLWPKPPHIDQLWCSHCHPVSHRPNQDAVPVDFKLQSA
jgi:hypothetical protein